MSNKYTYYNNFIVFYNGKDNDNYQDNDNFCCGKVKKGASKGGGIVDNEKPEKFQYYYHSDHLGSTSYITNLNGDIVQHVEYVPFGEVFLEERNNKWNTLYLFNGKELDEETGLYYYGARYYEAKTSLWFSVDPLAEKHPSVSPYVYVLNNPVKFIDPDGPTEEERKKAVARAKEYVSKNTSKSKSSYGYAGWQKGEPGKPIDCSGLVSEAANYSGFGHLNKGKGKTGVINIINNSRKESFNKMEEGNLVTFRKGGHIAIVTGNILRDDDGNVVSFDIVHSTNSKGPIQSTIKVDGSGKGYDGWWDSRLDTENVYQWDTQEDIPTYEWGTLNEIKVTAKHKTKIEPIKIDKVKQLKIEQ